MPCKECCGSWVLLCVCWFCRFVGLLAFGVVFCFLNFTFVIGFDVVVLFMFAHVLLRLGLCILFFTCVIL